MHRARLLVLLTLFGPALSAQAQIRQTNVRFEHLTVEDGLPDETVNAFIQDERGFVWIGTNDGLARHDGHGLTVFRHDPDDPNSLHDTTINELALASDGGLWLGTFSGVEHFDPVTGTFTLYTDDSGDPGRLPLDEYDEVLEDRHGRLWAGSDRQGLFQIDLTTGRVKHYPASADDPRALLQANVQELIETRDGTLWVATGLNGLHRYDPDTDAFTRFPITMPAFDESDGFPHIIEGEQGELWLGGWGLSRFDPATGETRTFLPEPDLPVPAPPRFDNYISSLEWDRQGRLWVGAYYQGLYRFDPATEVFEHFPADPTDATSLGDERVNELLLDRSGVLWVGTEDEGLSRLDPRREYVTRLWAPGQEGLHEMLEDHEGQLWFVFQREIIRWDPATGRGVTFGHGSGSGGLIDNYVHSITIVPSMPEVLWVGASDASLRRMDVQGRITARYPLADVSDSKGVFEGYPVFGVFESSSRPGVLWASVWDLGLCRLDPSTTEHACIDLGDTPRFITNDRLDPDVLWVGTFNTGLHRFDAATVTFTDHYRHDPADTTSLSIDLMADLYASRSEPGILWVGTWTGGLNRFDTRTGRVTRRYTEQNSDLPHNTITDVLEDESGIIWVSTARGVVRLDPRTGVLRDYTASLGLPRRNAGSFLSRTGEVIIGVHNESAYRFAPDDIALNLHAPEVFLTGFRIRDEEVKPGPDAPLQRPLAYTTSITLPYSDRDVGFDFVALDYVSPGGVRYAHRLEGYEEDWHYSEGQRRATYTNLPPGSYTFRVKAANSDGIWNEAGASVDVTIRPPWWRTGWAYAVYGLLLVGLVGLVDRIQRRRLVAREREKAREREIAQAQEIEQAYHELREAKDRLVQQEKLASLGQLTAGIAHEIKNPLNFVNNFAEVNEELARELREALDQGGDPGEILADLERNARAIAQHGKRADAIVRNMMQHASGGTGARQSVDINALVAEHIDLAYHGKRAQMPGLQVEIERKLEAEPGQIRVVPQDIGRVLLNLLGNAFDAVYERAGSENGQYKPRVTVSTRRVDGAVEIRVADNGMGVPPEALDRIFEPFYTTKPTGSGTGLGLSLSYDIVTQGHGGRLEVEDEGEGAVFVVWLPENAA